MVKNCGVILHFLIRLNDMALNYLGTGTTLCFQLKKKWTVDVSSTPAASSDIDWPDRMWVSGNITWQLIGTSTPPPLASKLSRQAASLSDFTRNLDGFDVSEPVTLKDYHHPLGCDTVYTGSWPTFRRNVLPLFRHYSPLASCVACLLLDI